MLSDNFLICLCAEYLNGSSERKHLNDALKNVSETVEEIPIIIGDEKFTSDDVRYQVMVSGYMYLHYLRNKFYQIFIKNLMILLFVSYLN